MFSISVFPFNLSDYQQEVPLGDDSLSEKLIKDMDTKKYAEKLTKYSQEKPVTDFIHDTESPKVIWESFILKLFLLM